MSSERSLDLPFAARISPERAAARARDLAWARRLRLLCTPEVERRYLRSQVAELAAFAYPEATGARLDLAFDVMGWFFLFDDQFDLPDDEHPEAALEACRDVIRLVQMPASVPVLSADAPPIVTAFADCWRRLTEGMTPDWVRRTAHLWVDYLEGNYTEIAARRHPGALDFATHLAVRRKTIGIRPSLALGEWIDRIDIPPLAWYSSHLEAMRVITIDTVTYVNEIFSFDKDEARGDANLIRLLMSERGCGRDEAMRTIHDVMYADARKFIALEQDVPRLCADLELDAEPRRAVDRHVACMRDWIGANYAWHSTSARYAADAVELCAADRPGMLHDRNVLRLRAAA
jgi:pentalenene synthase